MNKDLNKITIDASISVFIGICYRTARHLTMNAHVVKLLSHSPQAAFSAKQAFAIGSLSKSHTKKLIKACKRANTVINVAAIHATTKVFNREKIHDLRKYGLPVVH